jgi:hypothetical protein
MMSALTVAVVLLSAPVESAQITGDPTTDAGWTLAGHSLENGVHVKGSANYGFDAYSAGFAVQAGSNLEISDGTLSWLTGDTVVAVGGSFRSITAEEAGWDEITGTPINSLLPTTAPYVGPKLQVKFGTSAATWYPSTTAPGSGNGNSSSSSGGGRVQVRTSGWFQTGSPNPGQTEPWTWDGNSGQLLVLDKADHILWDGDPAVDKRVARMIWNWDDTLKQVSTWELLLNVSLLDRVAPESFGGLLPAIGDKAILTVQNGDSAYTDALVTIAAAESGLLGDFNGNGVVDAADYTVWRDNLGGGPIPNDPTPNSVDEDDFTYWREHFGQASPGSGAGSSLTASAAVPEPSSVLLLVSAAVGPLVLLRRRLA